MVDNAWNQYRIILLAGILVFMTCGLTAKASEHDDAAAPVESPDPWAALEMLDGNWEGAIDGKLGTGRGFRRCERLMGDRYLVCRHSSIRLPQEKSPKGDQHEELIVFSYDREREIIVQREFMSEGVVVQSTCTTEGMTVTCHSEAVESGTGIRSRLELEFADRYRFTEEYWLAWPGKDFEHYFTNLWTRSTAP
jgi:hypothetical protein